MVGPRRIHHEKTKKLINKRITKPILFIINSFVKILIPLILIPDDIGLTPPSGKHIHITVAININRIYRTSWHSTCCDSMWGKIPLGKNICRLTKNHYQQNWIDFHNVIILINHKITSQIFVCMLHYTISTIIW